MKQLNLFQQRKEKFNESSLYVLKLTNEVNYSQKTFEDFREIVSESEDIYPGIDLWFKHKVIPGIIDGNRYAYLVMKEGIAIAETIIKMDKDTKICSMRISPEYQNKKLGSYLFSKISNSLGDNSETIHFTAPESLVIDRKGLFKDLGFRNIGLSNKKYRIGEEEFVFEANTEVFKRNTSNLISKIYFNNKVRNKNYKEIILTIKSNYADQIINKRKTVEIKRISSIYLFNQT